MDPHPKCGLSVKTDVVTRTPKGYEEIYYYVTAGFLGQAGQVSQCPRPAQNGSKEQENGTDFGQLLWLGDGSGVRLSLHRQRLSSSEPPTILKEGATGLAPSFSQMWDVRRKNEA